MFFDLVFVFTITQLTALVEHHLSFVGIARAALVFVVLYWMYSGYAVRLPSRDRPACPARATEGAGSGARLVLSIL